MRSILMSLLFVLALVGCGEPDDFQPCLGGQSFEGWSSVLTGGSRFHFDEECPSRLHVSVLAYSSALVYYVKPWPPGHAWMTTSVMTNCPPTSELTMAIGLDRGYYPALTSVIERESEQTSGFGIALSIKSPEACYATFQEVWLTIGAPRQ